MKWFGKILTVLMAILVIAFSGGVNVAKHFCKGEVVAKALNTKVKECKKASEISCNYSIPSVQETPCCKTESDFYKSFHFEKTGKKQIALETTETIALPTAVYFSTQKRPINVYLNKPPPLSRESIYIIYEQFLI